MSRRGVWIALLGTDGSGKTTVGDRVAADLGPRFAAVRRFHLRPRFRHRDAGGPPVTDPHGRPPRGRVASLAKLAYWWLDCVVGYATVVGPALRRGELVLFDRYVDDLRVDPRRYRYGGPRSWAALLARAVPRPDLLVVLDAPVEVLRGRKVEVTPEETARQREAYRALAGSVAGGRTVDASAPPERVAEAVATLVLEARNGAG